jgi:hypothetical protein
MASGAVIPDDFSTRPTVELQTTQRESPSLPLATLVNHSAMEIDFANRRIWGDSFSKGSFAKDTRSVWEERLRRAAFDSSVEPTAAY